MKKNIIVITGGAGFVGSNLVERILDFKNFKIISIDDYSSGSKKNHIIDKRIKYIKTNTINISKVLKKYKFKINALFHFGEFSRIHQSFIDLKDCINSNVNGTRNVIDFCLNNKIKLIYSATSATLGNNGEDKNLSPYSLTKAHNLELLENYKKWFNLKYEVIYFYNVYGPKQISKGKMATVIGIFENQYLNHKRLTVVRPGNQTRKFTHISDTINVCILAWRKNLSSHYIISAQKSYSIIQIAKLFGNKIKFLPSRRGERFKSSIVKKNLNNKIILKKGKIDIKDYIRNFKRSHSL